MSSGLRMRDVHDGRGETSGAIIGFRRSISECLDHHRTNWPDELIRGPGYLSETGRSPQIRPDGGKNDRYQSQKHIHLFMAFYDRISKTKSKRENSHQHSRHVLRQLFLIFLISEPRGALSSILEFFFGYSNESVRLYSSYVALISSTSDL